MSAAQEPLTLGTAGHVDHGKTSLVAALTGVDTDRLPEEKARGLTIVLGYAQLALPSGRTLSLVDVPGHERFVRTMVAGASGIDMFLFVVAADDGVMPQTIEHAAVLSALAVERGVVAVTKADVADPARAIEQSRDLLPDSAIVACSARTGEGLAELLTSIDALAAELPSRAANPGPARLHIDRSFTVNGRGTVVTGTLWSGEICAGDSLELTPHGARVRVRGVQVHEHPVAAARAGQRVAVNLVGVSANDLDRGDVLATPGSASQTSVLDCCLSMRDARHGERVQVHHGTRAVPGRLAELGEGMWQLRLEQPLLAQSGDRLVVRRLAPPDTLGGGVVLDARARRHGARADVLERLRRLQRGEAAEPADSVRGRSSEPAAGPVACATDPEQAQALLALEQRLREAGDAMLSEAQLGGEARLLGALCRQGRAVRVSGRLYAHSEVARETRERILALIEAEGSTTLAGVRDALGISRKSAQAFLEHLDGVRVTRRLADDTRVLGSRRAARREHAR